jgi:hypothetical protein
MEKILEILVFKTNIKTQADRMHIKSILDAHPKILEWSVDMEDVDCVLRVVSDGITIDEIIFLITPTGYSCAELDA